MAKEIEQPTDDQPTDDVPTEAVVDDVTQDVTQDDQVTSDQVTASEGSGGMDVADASEQPPQPEYQDWQQPLIEAGLAGDDITDPAAWSQRSVEAIRERDRQIQELADRVRFYETQQRYGSQQQPPATPPTPEPQADVDPIEQLASNWDDQRWAEQFIEVDEDTGARRLRADISDVDRERVMQIDRQVRQWGEIIADPRQLLGAIDRRVQSIVERQFDTGWQQKTAAQRDEEFRNQFVNENASWLYAHDPATKQILRDPVSGNPAYSREGQEFLQYMDEVAEMGVTTLAGQIQLANDKRLAHRTQQTAAPGQRREELASVVQQKRRAKLASGNREPNARTSINGVSNEPLPESMSYGEKVLAVLKQGQ